MPNIRCVSSSCIHSNGKSHIWWLWLNLMIHSSFDSFHTASVILFLNAQRRRTTTMSWLIVNESSFTRFGRFYLTTNFLMHIIMALWSNVLMESFVDCFCAFSCTQQIIQKSKFSFRRAEWSKGLNRFQSTPGHDLGQGYLPMPLVHDT